METTNKNWVYYPNHNCFEVTDNEGVGATFKTIEDAEFFMDNFPYQGRKFNSAFNFLGEHYIFHSNNDFPNGGYYTLKKVGNI